jgi:hypothetical protein
MATIAEIKKFLENTYNYEVLESGTYKIIMDGDGGRSQLVFVEVNDTWLNVLSPFAEMDDVTPKQALLANSEYILGMQTLGDTYCVKYVALIADLDESEVVTGIEYAAGIADQLERELVGGDKF